MSRRARVHQFTPAELTNWPECPRPIESLPSGAAFRLRTIALALAVVVVLWLALAGLFLLPAMMFRML